MNVSAGAPGAPALGIDAAVVATLSEMLPRVAEETVAAIIVDVPSYAGALTGRMGANIEAAVEMSLRGFLKLASETTDAGTPLAPALEVAYSLGRGEARSERPMDALLTAYRVGARVAWRELSEAAATEMSAATMANFAALMFAYIDELSAASAAGHTAELASSSRVRDRYLEVLSRNLLAGAESDVLAASAERAGWPEPHTLTAILIPAAQVRGVISLLDPNTLQHELVEVAGADELALLLVPDAGGRGRSHALRMLAGRNAVVGPVRPWMQARSSYERAARAFELGLDAAAGPVDCDEHLARLVLGADGEALADLRARALAPLVDLRPATAERLADTLRSWLLHLGRRDDVAADLFVHAQTVRYRMGQVRELYGDRLDDPAVVLELTLALGAVPAGGAAAPAAP